MQPESQLIPYAARPRMQYRRPEAGEPITYGSTKKWVPNPSYNPYFAKAVGKGSGYKKRRYTRPYRRFATRGGYRGRRFRGYGAYIMDGSDPLLTQWGGWAGSKLGEAAGGAANSLVKSFTGFGDYQVKANALMPGAAIENPNTHGGTVFRGTEYLGDIISSSTPSAFKLQSFDINAALELCFPRLAQTLANYDQYVVEGMYFEFRTMSGESQSTSAVQLGSMIMSCNYNVLSPNFTSKQAMEEYDGGVSFKPSTSCKYFIECDRSQTPFDVLYTRTGAVPAGGDQRIYDLGNFQIASTGVTAASQNLGELWVSYQIAGLKPKMFSGFGNYNNALIMINTGFSNASPMFGGVSTVQYASPGVNTALTDPTKWTVGGTVLYFPLSPLQQTYFVFLNWQGTSTAITHPTYSYTNAVGYFTSTFTPANGSVSAYCTDSLNVTVQPNVQGSVSLSGQNLPTSGTSFILEAFQVPNAAVPV